MLRLLALCLMSTAVTADVPSIATAGGNLQMKSATDASVEINGVSHSLGELFATVADLSTRITSAEAENLALRTANSALQARVSTLETDCAREDQLVRLSGLITALTTRVTTDVSANFALISATATRVGALENTTFDYVPLTPNLIDNSFMLHTFTTSGRQIPYGFRTSTYRSGGAIRIEAVHPYTSAFEGPYCPLNSGGCPATRVTVPNSATQANPYVFGNYNKGPRAGRGGLSGGWAGRGSGKILKITGTRASNHQHDQVRLNFPMNGVTLTSKVLFRAFIKIVIGKCSLQTDVGNAPRWTRQQSEAAPQGWMSIHEYISTSHVTNLDSVHVLSFNLYGENRGPGGLAHGPFEVYLALPYMANIVQKHEDRTYETSPHWEDSINDELMHTGAIRYVNNNGAIRART